MRILWQSNRAGATTGYGTPIAALLPRLAALGHQSAVFAFYGLEGGKADLDGFPTYPRFADPYGNDVIAAHARDWRADVVVTLLDAWVLDPRVYGALGVPWLAWFPIDHEPIPPEVLARVPAMHRALSFSRHGEAALRAAGVPTAAHVPFGVDTDLFRPFNAEARRMAKAMLGFDRDAWVVGMVAANKGFPARKGFDEAFAAFKRLHDVDPAARLYVHAHHAPTYGGVDLVRLAALHGIGDLVRFPDPYALAMGDLGPEYLAIAYNALDTYLSASHGEGFGIPLLEAQACGVPVVANETTAVTENVDARGGLLVAPRGKVLTAQMSFQDQPDPIGLADGLVRLASEPAAGVGQRRGSARAFAEPFAWDLVVERHWRPLLDAVAAERGIPTPAMPRDIAPAEEDEAARAETAAAMERAAEVAGCALRERPPGAPPPHLPARRRRELGPVVPFAATEAMIEQALAS